VWEGLGGWEGCFVLHLGCISRNYVCQVSFTVVSWYTHGVCHDWLICVCVMTHIRASREELLLFVLFLTSMVKAQNKWNQVSDRIKEKMKNPTLSVSLSLCLYLSLYISRSSTHTHTHTQLSLSPTHLHTHTHTYTLSHTHTHKHTLSLSLSLAHILSTSL